MTTLNPRLHHVAPQPVLGSGHQEAPGWVAGKHVVVPAWLGIGQEGVESTPVCFRGWDPAPHGEWGHLPEAHCIWGTRYQIARGLVTHLWCPHIAPHHFHVGPCAPVLRLMPPGSPVLPELVCAEPAAAEVV